MTHTSRTVAVLLTALAVLALPNSACYADEEEKPTRNPSAEFLEFLKESGVEPKTLDERTGVDLESWPKDAAIGATARKVHGRKAGLAPESLPGAKFISLEEARRLKTAERQTGLFLVDIDFVPREMDEALKTFGFTLRKDGTLLDANQEPILALVTSEVFVIEERRASASLFTRVAYAASPFPWRCYSFTPWAVYHSGFHRWYDARTWAGAYGADGSGGCSSGSPYTRIDYLYTRAAVGGWGDSDHCFNCESEYSRDTWDVGYFWPAHGVPVTTHHAVYADGSFSFSRTAHLTW